jgi:hypothetical protein
MPHNYKAMYDEMLPSISEIVKEAVRIRIKGILRGVQNSTVWSIE